MHNVTGFGSPPDPQAEPIPGSAMARMLRTLRGAFAFTVVDATCDYSDHVLATLDISDVICLLSGLDAIGVQHLSIAMQTMQRQDPCASSCASS
jgi:pilus assembly protein CpaE